MNLSNITLANLIARLILDQEYSEPYAATLQRTFGVVRRQLKPDLLALQKLADDINDELTKLDTTPGRRIKVQNDELTKLDTTPGRRIKVQASQGEQYGSTDKNSPFYPSWFATDISITAKSSNSGETLLVQFSV